MGTAEQLPQTTTASLPIQSIVEAVADVSVVGSTAGSTSTLFSNTPLVETAAPQMSMHSAGIPNRDGKDSTTPSHPHAPPHPITEPAAGITVAETEDENANGVFVEPIQVQTQAEIAAALTEVLTHRMKPPRHPRQDLRLSTAAWLGLTGLGIALLFVSLFSSANYSREVLALGLAEFLIGYGWIIWLTSHRNLKRGILCAIPPITFYYLGQWKYAKFRPLRFAATGFVLLVLALLNSHLSPITRGWVKGDAPHVKSVVLDPEKMSKLEKMRDYRNQRAYDKLIDLLRDLSKTDAEKSVDAKDRPELALELKALCQHPDTGVKVAAMAAYARWGGDDAREICLKAIESSSQEERMAAIQLLPQWKNTDKAAVVAQAIASRIGRPGIESNRAEAALVEIDGVPAELAALGLLLRSEDQTTRLLVLSILDKVGGNESIAALRSYADQSLDPAVKSRSLDTIENIRKRLLKKGGK